MYTHTHTHTHSHTHIHTCTRLVSLRHAHANRHTYLYKNTRFSGFTPLQIAVGGMLDLDSLEKSEGGGSEVHTGTGKQEH
jgi:hypothetical protein